MVYFILNFPATEVKIGYSAHPFTRLRALQTGFAHELELLGAVHGDRSTESWYHGYFHSRRLHGEWFRVDEGVLEVIDKVLRDAEPTLVSPPVRMFRKCAAVEVRSHVVLVEMLARCGAEAFSLTGPQGPWVQARLYRMFSTLSVDVGRPGMERVYKATVLAALRRFPRCKNQIVADLDAAIDGAGGWVRRQQTRTVAPF